MLTRRAMLASTTYGLASLSVPGLALGQSAPGSQGFPNAQVRLVIPFPAGGATDVFGRLLTLQLQSHWGQTVIADYRPGAAGLIGARQVMTAPADGYTLLLASTGAILALASSQKADAAYRISRDLAPVSLAAAPPYVLTINPQVPARTAAELIDYGKKNPGKLTYGSSGAGSATHLSGALFAQMAGIEMLHVPFRGTGPAVTDLLGGRIDMLFAPAVVVTQHIEKGTLHAVGATTATRSALFPNMPTVAETGLPGYASIGWFGVFAPAGTPADIVTKISRDVGTVLVTAEARQRLAEQGAEPAPNAPAVFTSFVDEEIAKWLSLADKAGIKLN